MFRSIAARYTAYSLAASFSKREGISGKIMQLAVEVEQEEDGRWLSEVPDLPGVLAYGPTRAEAIVNAQVLALRVIADRIEHGEDLPRALAVLPQVFSVAA